MFSGSGETLAKEANAGDEEPGLCACDASFVVFGETTIATDPCKGTFDDPAFGLGLEVSHPLIPGDDLDSPPAELCRRLAQLRAAVDPIGKDVAQLRERGTQRPK